MPKHRRIATDDLLEVLTPLAGKRIGRNALYRRLHRILNRHKIDPRRLLNALYYRGLVCMHNNVVTVPPWWSDPTIVRTLVGDYLIVLYEEKGYELARPSRNST